MINDQATRVRPAVRLGKISLMIGVLLMTLGGSLTATAIFSGDSIWVTFFRENAWWIWVVNVVLSYSSLLLGTAGMFPASGQSSRTSAIIGLLLTIMGSCLFVFPFLFLWD